MRAERTAEMHRKGVPFTSRFSFLTSTFSFLASHLSFLLSRPSPLAPRTQRFPKDSLIATMSHASPSNVVRYSTVQVGENSHIELNSE